MIEYVGHNVSLGVYQSVFINKRSSKSVRQKPCSDRRGHSLNTGLDLCTQTTSAANAMPDESHAK
ncbi:hypothetical protein D083_1170 [Dickeya solani RNS 08.23.3.1.A]|nr:hypothetical protein D083_1170 [Dickeya solani RNS 08.23.3.1.A]